MEDKCDPNRMLQELLLLIIISCKTLQEPWELLDPIVSCNIEKQSSGVFSSHTHSAKAALIDKRCKVFSFAKVIYQVQKPAPGVTQPKTPVQAHICVAGQQP